MLLSIKINGKDIVLNDDFSFAINRENPIFNNPETLAGDYIESMTFQMKGNRDTFQNINRIESAAGAGFQPVPQAPSPSERAGGEVSIYYNNHHLISGTFTVKSATNNHITGDAKLNALSFFNAIKDLKLTDIPDSEMFRLGNDQKEVIKQINSITLNDNNIFPFRFC
ncbi:MAG: hypothetical protein FWF09_09145 [Bacteroidales bacterium]|nr:hypothetical protein [Bacteroidales bacterium]